MPKATIDTVRASREGHQYHEAWLARRALGLLLQRDGLCAVAVEGLSTEDQEDVSAPVVEVADATFYFGSGASFESCSRMEIEQFKYSIASENKEIRFFDAKKTLLKFSAAEADFVTNHGPELTSTKLKYSLITNRPIANDLLDAFRSAAAGSVPLSQGGKEQYEQLCAAVTFRGDQLKTFAARVEFLGRAGNLSTIEGENARVIADWSASDDVLVRARLGELSKLIRTKAGFSGQHNNLIAQVDVLAALGVPEEINLLPAPQAFPDPGEIVQREQLSDFVQRAAGGGCWIVHAAGGIGKTVFAQSLAKLLSDKDEVVLFDCFGGGAYRSIVDARHKPERGLLHIVNDLACRGLCDLILPGSSDPGEVVRRSLQRFRQAIEVLRRSKPTARLVIIIDAADNAALEARDRGHPAFPRELLESFSHEPPPKGLILVATARTERCDVAVGRAECTPYELKAFSIKEARAFIAARRKEATSAQMDALYRRADGNPRVLANLIDPDRSLAGEAATEDKVELPTLIEQRIARAVKLADQKGTRTRDISAFLCAISVLPPPVPISEIALAFGIAPAEVESFAADLSPLLDRTRHGIIFRDEPTETLVRHRYGSQLHLLDDVVERLSTEQSSSIYAARALPGLLFANAEGRSSAQTCLRYTLSTDVG